MRFRVWKRHLRATCLALATACGLLWPPAQALASCTPSAPVSNTTVTCSGTVTNQNGINGYGTGTENGLTINVNPVSVTGTDNGIAVGNNNTINVATGASVIGLGHTGIFSFGTATVTNSKTISGLIGIEATTATVTNSGTISGGGFGIEATTATVTNSGTISGGLVGIQATTATVTNSGTISGFLRGIDATTAAVTNSGTITGATGNFASAPSTLVNSGAIIGTGGTAIDFSTSHADMLTFLPGSRIQGLIDLGASDTVTFGTGNWLYTFGGPNALSTATINTGGAPFVVVGNQVATLDPTPFVLADKNLMDFTGAISWILGSLGPTTPLVRGPVPLAFAPSGIEAQVNDAFAAIPALAYGNDGVVFKNPTVVTEDGRSVWARGFVGERVQQADGIIQHATNLYAGGAVGADLLAWPDLRVGVFVGGGESRVAVDPNLEQTNTNTGFGGVYGRYAFTSFAAPSFLDFALHGGDSTNFNTASSTTTSRRVASRSRLRTTTAPM